MIRGISREKPALVFLRCIETAWSLYEMMGDSTMKTGARTAVASFMSPSMVGGKASVARDETRGGGSERSDGRRGRKGGKASLSGPRKRGEGCASVGVLSAAHGCGVGCGGGWRSMGRVEEIWPCWAPAANSTYTCENAEKVRPGRSFC